MWWAELFRLITSNINYNSIKSFDLFSGGYISIRILLNNLESIIFIRPFKVFSPVDNVFIDLNDSLTDSVEVMMQKFSDSAASSSQM